MHGTNPIFFIVLGLRMDIKAVTNHLDNNGYSAIAAMFKMFVPLLAFRKIANNHYIAVNKIHKF